MLTIFCSPKPTADHIEVIQANALRSWTLLKPAPEVIVFSSDRAIQEQCERLGIRSEPEGPTNEYGTPLLDALFDRAQRISKYPLVAYINSDILLMSCFSKAVGRFLAWRKTFLVAGRRCDLRIDQELDFARGWETRLRALALSDGHLQPASHIDWFVFRAGTLVDLEPLALGRLHWDNWLIWKARQLRMPVVDATSDVVAIHQNHDYRGVSWRGSRQSVEIEENERLAGGWSRSYTLLNATHRLRNGHIRRNLSLSKIRADAEMVRRSFIDATRPIRQRLAG